MAPNLQIRLLGRLSVRHAGERIEGLESKKAQELLCYLLLHRDKAHHREALGSLLWPDCTLAQSKKYLRQSIWQLQVALDACGGRDAHLSVDNEWIQLLESALLSLDVAKVDDASSMVAEGLRLRDGDEDAVVAAIDVYEGELLEGWYHEWCVFERACVHRKYLRLADCMMEHCLRSGDFARGREIGLKTLRFDRARETTHRLMMRLHAEEGDRTGAIRQYEWCTSLLAKDLGAGPSNETREAFDHVRSAEGATSAPPSSAANEGATTANGSEAGDSLAEVLRRLDAMQEHVEQLRALVASALEGSGS